MITIGYSTRVSNPEYKKYLQKTCMFKEVEIIEKVNNGEKSLSEVYNEIIEESTNDIIVLCHDDIEFDTKNWGEKLLKNFDKTDYGILGLAGSTSLSESGTWWETPLTMRGIVNHKKDGNKWESKYSINDGKISNTLLIDGLFIAFNKRKIVHKFDESVEGFHFYDLTFSFSNFLKGVKIGVTYDVRVTHLSIGETNEQWEKNKISFIEKFKTELPKKLIEPIDITTFIICHDESIIKNNIQSKKFNSLGDVKFLYVGKNEFDDINLYPNVIIVRDLKYNIEQYPRFTAFTAWYAIWKNNLCTTKYLNLLEYDVNLNEDFNFYLSNVIKMKPKIVSYFPLTMRNYHYINNPDWVTSITKGIKLAYKTDIRNFVTGIIIDSINKNVEPIWPTTNNVCFEYTTFDKYMKWIQPLISYMKDDPYSGHNQERALSFFSLMNKVPVAYFQGYIEHVQADSHKTQGHDVDLSKLDGNEKKNAITVLSRGYNDINHYQNLILRNKYIYENIILKSTEKFDVIVFHEGNITYEHQVHISSHTPNMDIKFINVKTTSPKTAFDDSRNKINMELCPPNHQSNSFPLGYKHMCHFWSIDFIEYLKEYKYVIRIDEDCFVTKFDTNVIKEMSLKKQYFLSPKFQGQDEWYVIVGLEKLWDKFIKENEIKPLKKFNEISCPYTNFMIFDMEYLKDNKIIKKILNEIENSHGIYSNRWGDLPIWGMIISTLIDNKHYSENNKISYFHGSHNIMINNI